MSKSLALPTLVLNRTWQPISVHSVKKSLQKVFAGAAKILDTETCLLHDFDAWRNLEVLSEHKIISTPNSAIRVPEVIVLINYDKFPERDVKLTRRNLLIRDQFQCQYTGKKLSSKDATIDHVIPQSKGGKTTWENVVICCSEANSRKGDKTLADAGMQLLKYPKKPKWNPIFSRFAKYASVQGCPDSWKKFVNWDPSIYWDIELDED